MSRTRAFARELASDLFIVAGAAAITFGAFQLHPSAGYVVGGVLLAASGFLVSLGGR